MRIKKQVEETFVKIFGGNAKFVSVTAPGRANLIGEHVDYQGGYVLPIAVDRFICGIGRKRSDNKIKLFSFNYNESFETTPAGISYNERVRWANYIMGVIQEFKKLGYPIPGMEVVFGGDVPAGSGLSSSAAVEVCTAVLLEKLCSIKVDPIELIKLARRAENEFVGVQCGIMDQFASYLSKENNALLLNCNTLDYRYIPLKIDRYSFLLVDTKKTRSLSSSVYNERVESIKEALKTIKKYEDVMFLTEIKDLNTYRDKLSEETFKRARHIVEENNRVLLAVKKLENDDIEGFGTIMYESHTSLRDLYEVSCEELDFIVDFSTNFEGVKGARLTGAGMGGCTLVLLKKEVIQNYKNQLSELYEKRFGRRPEFYEVRPVNGAHYENIKELS